MLRPRIIPCLLLHNKALVKTIRFSEPKYVGDPINTVRIFNEKEVDEIIIADIDASISGLEPDYEIIAKLASECRMPLCYAGGITKLEQVEHIISLGVEKVAIGSAAIQFPELITESASRVGSQSIVVVLDVKKNGLMGSYELFTHNGRRPTGLNPVAFARIAESLGAGEIIINSIDRDGVMIGYDLSLIDMIRDAINLPLSVLGGAGNFADLESLICRYGLVGAAAGSLFIFKGKYRAVLIQYPTSEEKEALFQRAGIDN